MEEQSEFKRVQAQHIEPEPVEIGKEFSLFDPQRTRSWINSEGGRDSESKILLEIPGLSSLRVGILSAAEKVVRKIDGMTPFEPSMGYEVSAEDKDPYLRQMKAKEMEMLGEEIGEEHHNHLFASSSPKDLIEAGVAEHAEEDSEHCIPNSDFLRRIENIRLILHFPTGLSYEGVVNAVGANEAGIHFNSFYPIDFGPLVGAGEGKGIYTPGDLNLLSQIKGEFIEVRSNSKDLPNE